MLLGVLGGTFDPPHIGHLILAELARDQLGLERVLWVPAADPPHKQGQAITPAVQRVEMLEIALRSNPHFVLSRADLDRPGPHYTVDLLDILAGEYPEATFYFLMGGDSLRDLPTWHRPERLIEQCTLAVMPRPYREFDMDVLEASLPGIRSRVVVIESPLVDIAARQIVGRVRAGRTIRYLVPDSVGDYISTHRLYRSHKEERARKLSCAVAWSFWRLGCWRALARVIEARQQTNLPRHWFPPTPRRLSSRRGRRRCRLPLSQLWRLSAVAGSCR